MLTITIANVEWVTLKNKLVTYNRAFVRLYNQKNHKQIYEIYEMIELDKMRTLTVENPRNLDAHQIIEIP